MNNALQNLGQHLTGEPKLAARAAIDRARLQQAGPAGVGAADEGGFDADLAKAKKNLRKASEALVASTLVLPMLKQMRDDPFKSDLFHGGFGEDVFGSQMDMEMSGRLAQGRGWGVTEVLTDKFFDAVKTNPVSVQRAVNMRIDEIG